MKELNELLAGVKVLESHGNLSGEISAVAFDSRKVGAGSLFVAVRGTVVDGHDFIKSVVAAGVAAIVCESIPEEITPGPAYIRVNDSSEALGIIASAFYDNPSSKLHLVGITGTNGKTTVATLLYKLFEELGYKSGLISTVENHIHHTVLPSTHTTPDPVSLNRLLDEMVGAGCDYCFMEVSSHAVSQHRIAGLSFAGGVFTNLTHDHLDYHKTFRAYLEAKKAFFDGLPKRSFALVNVDDKNGQVMLQNTAAYKKGYALKTMADFKARVIDNALTGLELDVEGQEVWFKLVGMFNAYNLLAVYAAACLLDQDKNKVLTILSRLTGAEGRFDTVTGPGDIIGVVDYAHTPDAVQNVLSTIQAVRKGTEQIITVLGCGGDRDKTKRPIMAQVASDWSDKLIITSDNPRTEDPLTIIAEMEAGVPAGNKKKVLTISGRMEAIHAACHMAQPGDIILIAGKGHEKYQDINGVKHPFDDKEILVKQLQTIA